MIDGCSVMAVIPARGGSKGLVGKNIRPLGGKPLIVWSIEQAQAAATIDRVVLSSDDAMIMAIAEEAGCEVPFRRPAGLATDEATTLDVLRHLTQHTEQCDYLVLLQPTSPLRTSADIDQAVAVCRKSGASSCVSVTPADKSPYWMYVMQDDLTLESCMPTEGFASRRQDLPQVHVLNGAIYVIEWRRVVAGEALLSDATVGYVMPPERSIDIDHQFDIDLAEFLMQRTP